MGKRSRRDNPVASSLLKKSRHRAECASPFPAHVRFVVYAGLGWICTRGGCLWGIARWPWCSALWHWVHAKFVSKRTRDVAAAKDDKEDKEDSIMTPIKDAKQEHKK